RQVADTDRRRVEHKVTEAGRQALAAADEAITLRLAECLTHLDQPQLGTAVDGLRAWSTALERSREARRQLEARRPPRQRQAPASRATRTPATAAAPTAGPAWSSARRPRRPASTRSRRRTSTKRSSRRTNRSA